MSSSKEGLPRYWPVEEQHHPSATTLPSRTSTASPDNCNQLAKTARTVAVAQRWKRKAARSILIREYRTEYFQANCDTLEDKRRAEAIRLCGGILGELGCPDTEVEQQTAEVMISIDEDFATAEGRNSDQLVEFLEAIEGISYVQKRFVRSEDNPVHLVRAFLEKQHLVPRQDPPSLEVPSSAGIGGDGDGHVIGGFAASAVRDSVVSSVDTDAATRNPHMGETSTKDLGNKIAKDKNEEAPSQGSREFEEAQAVDGFEGENEGQLSMIGWIAIWACAAKNWFARKMWS